MENFLEVGQSLWTVLLAFVGGVIARYFYWHRQKQEAGLLRKAADCFSWAPRLKWAIEARAFLAADLILLGEQAGSGDFLPKLVLLPKPEASAGSPVGQSIASREGIRTGFRRWLSTPKVA